MRQTPEEKARIAQVVNENLDACRYRINIDYMTPRRGAGRAVTYSYSLIVDGSKVDSHLPYVGVAYDIPYGGGKVLTFTDTIDEYYDTGWQKGRRVIKFATNNDEDIIIYSLTVYENGRVYVDVNCRKRDDISYRGMIDTDISAE